MRESDIVRQGVGRQTEAADPGFGVFILGAVGTEGCLALGAVDWGRFDGSGFGKEGRVEVAEGHDHLVRCVAGGGQCVKHSSPAGILLVFLHVNHLLNQYYALHPPMDCHLV